ncbi:CLAVATA3/ESR (CLE)-related protein 25 [Linum grandiflorum]
MGRSSTKPSIVWLMWLLLIGSFELQVVLSSSANDMPSTIGGRRLMIIRRGDDEVEKDSKVVGKVHELNYMMSKRRVPNGPDPIHNRRAGNSKRPPGRA